MKTQLLKDPEIRPGDDVLKNNLKKVYPVYRKFIETMESDSFRFAYEWRYYRDGGGWLCKITYKKKTVAWLSVWSFGFKLSLYFTEKSGEGISKLDIPESTKERFRTHKSTGRLKPLIFEVNNRNQLSEVFTLLKFKAGVG